LHLVKKIFILLPVRCQKRTKNDTDNQRKSIGRCKFLALFTCKAHSNTYQDWGFSNMKIPWFIQWNKIVKQKLIKKFIVVLHWVVNHGILLFTKTSIFITIIDTWVCRWKQTKICFSLVIFFTEIHEDIFNVLKIQSTTWNTRLMFTRKSIPFNISLWIYHRIWIAKKVF